MNTAYDPNAPRVCSLCGTVTTRSSGLCTRCANPPVAIKKSEPLGPDGLLTFLEAAGMGCVSGSISDWPQLKPACKWGAEQIKMLRRDLAAAREELRVAKGEAP